MCVQQDFEITINDSEISTDSILNQEFVPDSLKDSIKASNVLFVPKIINNKPFYEVETLDLFNYFKNMESEGFKTELCVTDDDFQFRKEEGLKEYIVLGWLFVKYVVIKPFFKKLKEYMLRKVKINMPIELKVTVKKTKQTKTIDINIKGLPDSIDHALDKLKDFWNE
ncbi:hypothetical protein LCGC14_1384860 [marine sediment metagenome]|uniref:Uncharacterized protein n=1 Tax=marine sediment metagenome TaxID=412755 RepID=A0A0F9K1M6_9ZZZZ